MDVGVRVRVSSSDVLSHERREPVLEILSRLLVQLDARGKVRRADALHGLETADELGEVRGGEDGRLERLEPILAGGILGLGDEHRGCSAVDVRGSNPGARDAQPRERARRGFAAGGRDERERGRAQDRDDDRDHRAMPRHRAPGRSQQRLGLGRHVGVTETVVRIRRGCFLTRRGCPPRALLTKHRRTTRETARNAPTTGTSTGTDAPNRSTLKNFPLNTDHSSSSLPIEPNSFPFFRTRETTAERFRVTPLSSGGGLPAPPPPRE